MKKAVLCLIGIASILLGGCWLVDEREFVLTNPQSVIASSNPKVKIDAFLVDGTNISSAMHSLTIRLLNPRQQLSGINTIDMIATGAILGKNNYEFVTSISLPMSNDPAQLHIWPLWIGVDDLIQKSLYPERMYRTDFYEACPLNSGQGYRGPDKPPVVPLIPRGSIVLEQRTKHIILKGTFNIPPTPIPRDPYMICDSKVDEKGFLRPTTPLSRNPAPPAIIEVRGIHLDIDTDLTYRWCGKGGDCYEK